MEPFHFQQDVTVPHFSLTRWEREFPHLIAGMSARDRESVLQTNLWNYAFQVGGMPDQTIQNRKRLTQELGISFSSWTCGSQVHGTVIREVSREGRGRGSYSGDTAFSDTDGLLTREEDVLLTSFYADCVPLLFYSPDSGWIGVAHAGWRGTVGGIGQQMVEEMVIRGANRRQIHVAVAPSIGSCCYEVDKQVVSPLIKVLPNADERVLKPSGPGKWMLDLREANKQLLLQVGLLEKRIAVTGWCTSCHPELFHSHRRDQGKTGRMVAFIGKRKG